MRKTKPTARIKFDEQHAKNTTILNLKKLKSKNKIKVHKLIILKLWFLALCVRRFTI